MELPDSDIHLLEDFGPFLERAEGRGLGYGVKGLLRKTGRVLDSPGELGTI